MTWWIPRADFSAPGRPFRSVGVVLAVAAFLCVGLAVTVPGAGMPGVAAESLTGNRARLEFQSGDRYFWLPSQPAHALTASDFLADLPGHQWATKRANYTATSRLLYDEERHGPADFSMDADFLYEISGVFEDATVEYEARPGSAGRSFLEDVRAGSNRFWHRAGEFPLAVPGLVASDLMRLVEDVRALFHGRPGDAQPTGFESFLEHARDHWPILAGFVAWLLAANLLGAPALLAGFVGAMLLAMGGFWVLAAASAVAGLVLDPGRASGLGPARSVLLWGALRTGEAADRRPRVAAGLIVLVASAALGIVLGYLGYARVAAIVVVLGTLAGAYASLRAREPHPPSWAAGYASGRWVVVGLSVAAVAANALVLLRQGFAGFGWALLVYATVLAFRPRKPIDVAGEAWGRLSLGERFGAALALFLVWVTVAAFADGLTILGLVYGALTLGLAAVLAWFYAPRHQPGHRRRQGPRVEAEEVGVEAA